MEAALGYYINPLVSVLIGAVVLREHGCRAAMGGDCAGRAGVAVLTL